MMSLKRHRGWAAFAVVFGALSAIGFVSRLVQVLSGDGSVGGGVAGLLVGLPFAFWITAGAWRRSARPPTRVYA